MAGRSLGGVSRPVSPDDISPISIAAEGFRGIDGRSAAGGDVPGDSGNEEQSYGHSEIGGQIPGRGSKQQRGDYFGHDERDHGAYQDAGKRQSQRSGEHVALYPTGSGTERHAYTDLRPLARNAVGDDAIDAERGQYQAESCKCGYQEHEETAGRDGAVDD